MSSAIGVLAASVAPANRIVIRDVHVDHHTATGVIRALDPVSLELDGGSSTAIVGPSGCGKSTLLGLIGALALPTAGSIVVGEISIGSLDERARVRLRRARIGIVYQSDNLLPHLTVEENVGLQLAIASAAHDAPRASPTAALLDRLGIGDLARRFPDQLSGGQRQRVAVARAIVHRPAVILADEPTGALDAANAQAVVDLLVEAHRSLGSTLVIVTHDPQVATQLERTVELSRPAGGSSRARPLRRR